MSDEQKKVDSQELPTEDLIEKESDPTEQPAPSQEDSNEDDFEALLNEYLPGGKSRKSRGELVDAIVVGTVDDVVLVSCGGKAETSIAMREFLDAKGELTVKPGDSIRVLLTGYTRDGVAQLSYYKARAAAAGKMLEEAHKAHKPVTGTICEVIRGGVLVDVGLRAFMPGSQVELFRAGDLSAYVGKEIEAYVIEYDEKRERAVLSRRQLLEERKKAGQGEFFDKISPGETIKGTVRDVLDFGVFVDLGLVEGMIPRSELSYDRGVIPTEVVSAGQEIEVKILDLNRETGKVTLSRKRLGQDPWATITERYPVGQAITGKVVTIQKFGAFVQLEEGITGLIHTDDMSWEKEKKPPEEYFKLNDSVTCQVLSIDTTKKRLALGLKHLMRDPWNEMADKYPVGSKQKGVVTSIRPFGAFVKLDEYTEGLLHISDLSWTKRVKDPSEILKAGDETEVVILKLDKTNRRIGLGLKQLSKSPIATFQAEHKVNTLVSGIVTRLMPFGAFVDVGDGLEGLIHISEAAEQRTEQIEKVLHVGDEVNVLILAIEPAKERISLSIKKAARAAERMNIKEYQKNEKAKEAATGGAFGDLLSQALKNKK
jgi:small subunit ribosomal protein S1